MGDSLRRGIRRRMVSGRGVLNPVLDLALDPVTPGPVRDFFDPEKTHAGGSPPLYNGILQANIGVNGGHPSSEWADA